MASDDIEKLIDRVSLKDRQAFASLYEVTSAKLFGICLRILGDRGEAEEALQDVYIKIWQRADRFSAGRASAIAWLSAIARNHAIDVVRARRPSAKPIETAHDLPADGHDPEARAVLSAEGRRIAACMEELEENRAAAVAKAYVEGLSYDELARFYAVPLNTMRTWLRRSLIKLKECLER